jgi:heme/copper-type cytochrome/quinol oxidase subunit 2
MTLVTTILAAAEEGHHGNVALETVIFFVIALAVFAALALVVFSYRDVANRHAGKAQAYAQSHGAVLEHGTVEHGTASGH